MSKCDRMLLQTLLYLEREIERGGEKVKDYKLHECWS